MFADEMVKGSVIRREVRLLTVYSLTWKI